MISSPFFSAAVRHAALPWQHRKILAGRHLKRPLLLAFYCFPNSWLLLYVKAPLDKQFVLELQI